MFATVSYPLSMNRSIYFNSIEEKINLLAVRINSRGRLNILDFHLHSENFYADLLNELYRWNLSNLNSHQQNVEAIDLVDSTNKLFVQVSATNTKQKIESSLSKESLRNYEGYIFKFISIANDSDDLRKKTYDNPNNIRFDPKNDIIDKISILKFVSALDIDSQKSVCELVRKELGGEMDLLHLETNLATVIGILSKEDLAIIESNIEINSFEIGRKIAHNDLNIVVDDIRYYSSFYQKLENVYIDFDKQGRNKSVSVLRHIRKQYITICKKQINIRDGDAIFLQIAESIKDIILKSTNYKPIPVEELEHCISIAIVHAFIECKIFENPESYKYVTS